MRRHLVLATAAPLRTAWRLARRRRAKFPGGTPCPQCGYDLTGNVSGVCPECGMITPSRDAR